MCIGKGVLICGESVGRVVVACAGILAQLVFAGTGGVVRHFGIGSFAVGEVVPAVGVAGLVEAICEVAADGELFDGLDVDAEGIGEVGLALNVGVCAAAYDGVAEVTDAVADPGVVAYPCSVGVLEGEHGESVAVEVCEGVLHVACALIVVLRAIEGRIVADSDPFVDGEVEFRAEVEFFVFVRIELENAFAQIGAAGEEVFEFVLAAAEADVILLRGM